MIPVTSYIWAYHELRLTNAERFGVGPLAFGIAVSVDPPIITTARETRQRDLILNVDVLFYSSVKGINQFSDGLYLHVCAQ